MATTAAEPVVPSSADATVTAVAATSGNRVAYTTSAAGTSVATGAARPASPSHRAPMQQLSITHLEGAAVTALSAAAAATATAGHISEKDEVDEGPVLGSALLIAVGIVLIAFVPGRRVRPIPARVSVCVDSVMVVQPTSVHLDVTTTLTPHATGSAVTAVRVIDGQAMPAGSAAAATTAASTAMPLTLRLPDERRVAIDPVASPGAIGVLAVAARGVIGCPFPVATYSSRATRASRSAGPTVSNLTVIDEGLAHSHRVSHRIRA